MHHTKQEIVMLLGTALVEKDKQIKILTKELGVQETQHQEQIAALTKDKYRGPNCAECSMHGNYDL